MRLVSSQNVPVLASEEVRYTIEKTTDLDEVHELHLQTFPRDPYVDEDHEFWVARSPAGWAVAFASCTYFEDIRTVYLSRVGVLPEAAGSGLQRRFILLRLQHARRCGAMGAVTYTTKDNYQSITNLIRTGFRFMPVDGRSWRNFHCFFKPLGDNVAPAGPVWKRIRPRIERRLENA